MKSLLKNYTSKKQVTDYRRRDQLIRDYTPLIKQIAKNIAVRLPPSIDTDDLLSAGVIGLIDAIDKYDPKRNNKFKTYAEYRIRGAMLDELRTQDWVPRSVRDKLKLVLRLHASLEQRYGRSVTATELAQEMKIPVEKLQTLLCEINVPTFSSFDEGQESIAHTYAHNALSQLLTKSFRLHITTAINTLPDTQRVVIALYYHEEFSLKEIGNILGVTESRVSQIRTQAIAVIRTKMDFKTP